jgi:ABC-type nickel/cobalt efflux system permease component RcnA
MRTSKITAEEKQSLIAPFVIGGLCGLVAVVAVVAFASEYRASIYQASFLPFWLQITAEALVAFLCVLGGCVLAFGVLPVVMHRVASRAKPDA